MQMMLSINYLEIEFGYGGGSSISYQRRFLPHNPLSSIYLHSLVLPYAHNPHAFVPAYTKDFDSISPSLSALALYTLPLYAIHAFPNPPLFLAFARANVPYTAGSIMTPTHKAIRAFWITCQADDSIAVATQSHCRDCSGRSPRIDKSDMPR